MRLFQTLVALAALLVCGTKADAAFTLALSSGSHNAIVNLATATQTGGNTLVTVGSAGGASFATGFISAFGYNFTFAASNNQATPGATTGALGLTILGITRPGMEFNATQFPVGSPAFTSPEFIAENFKIELSQTGYTVPTGASTFSGNYKATFPIGSAANVTFSSSYNATNTLSASSTGTTAGNFSPNQSLTAAGGFTLTNVFNITGGFTNAETLNEGQVNGLLERDASGSVAAAPAPAALILGLLGVPMFGMMVRRWNRKPAEEITAA